MQPREIESGKLKVFGQETGCPVCAAPALGAVHICPKCATPHHAECWAYVGRCAVYGCQPGQPTVLSKDEAKPCLAPPPQLKWLAGLTAPRTMLVLAFALLAAGGYMLAEQMAEESAKAPTLGVTLPEGSINVQVNVLAGDANGLKFDVKINGK